MSECTHNCETCGHACGGAGGQETFDFSAKLADFSRGSLQLLAIEE